MGHTYLGTGGSAAAWREVAGLLNEGVGAPRVAEAALTASNRAFEQVQNDFGFREAVWLLAQFGVAGTKADPVQHLDSVGISVKDAGSVVDVALAVGEELDRRAEASRGRTDFGEMARRALIASMVDQLQAKGELFDRSKDELVGGLKKLGKEKEFARFARGFFGKLTNQFLGYFLSKTLAAQLGEKKRFATTQQVAEFERALAKHCGEVSEVVEQFSGEWFSKNKYEGGGDLSREVVESFGWYAVEKLRKEVAARAL